METCITFGARKSVYHGNSNCFHEHHLNRNAVSRLFSIPSFESHEDINFENALIQGCFMKFARTYILGIPFAKGRSRTPKCHESTGFVFCVVFGFTKVRLIEPWFLRQKYPFDSWQFRVRGIWGGVCKSPYVHQMHQKILRTSN